MAKYYLTNKAVEDLTEIWNFTFLRWSEEQADRYYQFLLDNCHELAHNPKMGKSYNQIANSLLGFRANRHVIFYRIISSSEIEITRILHGRMDLKNRFSK